MWTREGSISNPGCLFFTESNAEGQCIERLSLTGKGANHIRMCLIAIDVSMRKSAFISENTCQTGKFNFWKNVHEKAEILSKFNTAAKFLKWTSLLPQEMKYKTDAYYATMHLIFMIDKICANFVHTLYIYIPKYSKYFLRFIIIRFIRKYLWHGSSMIKWFTKIWTCTEPSKKSKMTT